MTKHYYYHYKTATYLDLDVLPALPLDAFFDPEGRDAGDRTGIGGALIVGSKLSVDSLIG